MLRLPASVPLPRPLPARGGGGASHRPKTRGSSRQPEGTRWRGGGDDDDTGCGGKSRGDVSQGAGRWRRGGEKKRINKKFKSQQQSQGGRAAGEGDEPPANGRLRMRSGTHRDAGTPCPPHPSPPRTAKPRESSPCCGGHGGTVGGLCHPPHPHHHQGTWRRRRWDGGGGAVPPPLPPAPRNKQSQLSAPEPAHGQVIEAPGLDLPPAHPKAALATQTTAPPHTHTPQHPQPRR